MRELIVSGVRYRFANGLRGAMRMWGTLIVIVAVAAGLEAQPPLFIWIRKWGASPHPLRVALALSFGIAVAVRPLLVAALRRHGQRDFLVLPLTRAQRVAVDGAAVILFLLVPFGALLAVAIAAGVTGSAMLAMGAATAFLVVTLGDAERTSASRGGLSLAGVPHEIRWLLRTRGVPGAVATALITMLAAWLAIHNNEVTSSHAVARIKGFFAAVAALILAAAIVRARTSLRTYRVSEALLPISSGARMRSLCAASIVLAFPLLAAGFAAPFAFLLLLSLVLLGEHFSLLAAKREWELNVIAGWGAVVAALDLRVATIAALCLLPIAWSCAVTSDRRCDLPAGTTEPA